MQWLLAHASDTLSVRATKLTLFPLIVFAPSGQTTLYLFSLFGGLPKIDIKLENILACHL
jgi:hypothetical protein